MAVYSHPLFDILLDRPQSKSREGTILHKLFLTREDDSDFSTEPKLAQGHSRWSFGRRFWEMGQMEVLDELTVMLLLMRHYENLNDPGEHALLCRYVYDCLSYAASVTFLYPHQRLLAHCVQRLHQRSPISYWLCEINWELLFDIASTIFQLRTSGAGHEQMRALHSPESPSAWSVKAPARYATRSPDRVSPVSLVEERWWSGRAMERAAQSAKPA
jgi:hypothetical protein